MSSQAGSAALSDIIKVPRARALYLTSWTGGIFLKDRVGKGKNDPDAEILVDNLALCILGGIQPDRLAQLGDLTVPPPQTWPPSAAGCRVGTEVRRTRRRDLRTRVLAVGCLV